MVPYLAFWSSHCVSQLTWHFSYGPEAEDKAGHLLLKTPIIRDKNQTRRKVMIWVPGELALKNVSHVGVKGKCVKRESPFNFTSQARLCPTRPEGEQGCWGPVVPGRAPAIST